MPSGFNFLKFIVISDLITSKLFMQLVVSLLSLSFLDYFFSFFLNSFFLFTSFILFSILIEPYRDIASKNSSNILDFFYRFINLFDYKVFFDHFINDIINFYISFIYKKLKSYLLYLSNIGFTSQ